MTTKIATHDKLEMLLSRLNEQPSKINNFNWIIKGAEDREFYPSQLGVTKEDFVNSLSTAGYCGEIRKSLVKKRLNILIEKYKTK